MDELYYKLLIINIMEKTEELLKTKKDKLQFKKWIKALRSGDYKQGRNKLQSKDGYCCLGVACKVLIPSNKLHYNVIGHIFGGLPDDQINAPKWLKKIDNTDFFDKTAHYLASLNDNKYFSFDEIADLLELVYIHKILD